MVLMGVICLICISSSVTDNFGGLRAYLSVEPLGQLEPITFFDYRQRPNH